MACEEPICFNIDHEIEVTDFAGDNHISIPGIEKIKRVVICKKVIFKERADWEDCIHYLSLLNAAGTMTIEYAYDDTPNLVKIWSNGSTQYTSMECVFLKATEFKRIGYGDGDVWGCNMIMFRQAG